MVFKSILQSSLAVAFVAGLITALPTSQAHAEVIFKQEIKFFDVRGETSQEIFKDFQKKSPVKSKGQYDATLGVAAIQITPKAEYEVRGRRCHAKNPRIVTDVVIHLPKWVNYGQADPFSKQTWDDLFEKIKAHELQHAAIAKDYAKRMDKKIESHLSRSSCKSIERALQRASGRLLKKHDAAQRRFDRKEYGRLLGG